MATELEDLQSAMKAAMRRLAGTVCVVAARSGETCHAMSATSVTSLSMDPPSLLVCVNRAAPFHGVLAAAPEFCVNILSAEQAELSSACGGRLKGEARFGLGDWETAGPGAPRLRDGVASLLCRTAGRFDYGSHSIFVGEAREIRLSGKADPLLYLDGGYATAARLRGAAA